MLGIAISAVLFMGLVLPTHAHDAMSAVVAKLPLSGFIILALLIVQFNSFRKTFIVLSTIPLGLIGVIAGLLVFRSFFGFFAFLGLISLAGIVINNAIVLIDRIQIELNQSGRASIEAIVAAAQQRFRPILLTTCTTTLGLLPLYFGRRADVGADGGGHHGGLTFCHCDHLAVQCRCSTKSSLRSKTDLQFSPRTGQWAASNLKMCQSFDFLRENILNTELISAHKRCVFAGSPCGCPTSRDWRPQKPAKRRIESMSESKSDARYTMGRTQGEEERLIQQSQLYDAITRRFF